MTILMPNSEASACAMVSQALAAKTPLSITGGGTRSGLGRPNQTGLTLSASKLNGITLYEPAEMVIGAKAGTPLKTIEETLAARGQMLPFEPMDHRALYGTTREPTIGAVASGNISGPRRINGGAARDALIGVRLINGRGEAIKSGGRVMKNVTGLDLVKLQAGAFGTLGILTEVIFKVVPKPETVATLVLTGLEDAIAIAAMAEAVTSPFEITGAAHLPDGVGGEGARTYLRIEGFAESVDYRAAELGKLLACHGKLMRLDGSVGVPVWSAIRDAAPLAEPRDAAIWRLSVKPSRAAEVVAAIRATRSARALYDWGGGLVWLATDLADDAGATAVRAAAKAAKGYATLMRAPDSLRAAIPVFEPEAAPVAALTRRIKTSVDPAGIINPGRMFAGV